MFRVSVWVNCKIQGKYLTLTVPVVFDTYMTCTPYTIKILSILPRNCQDCSKQCQRSDQLTTAITINYSYFPSLLKSKGVRSSRRPRSRPKHDLIPGQDTSVRPCFVFSKCFSVVHTGNYSRAKSTACVYHHQPVSFFDAS